MFINTCTVCNNLWKLGGGLGAAQAPRSSRVLTFVSCDLSFSWDQLYTVQLHQFTPKLRYRKKENRYKKRHNIKNMTTLMETRIYNLLIVMKMGQAFDLKVILTKE